MNPKIDLHLISSGRVENLRIEIQMGLKTQKWTLILSVIAKYDVEQRRCGTVFLFRHIFIENFRLNVFLENFSIFLHC